MRYEGVVDIFQTVKMLRTQRPAMVQTEVRKISMNLSHFKSQIIDFTNQNLLRAWRLSTPEQNTGKYCRKTIKLFNILNLIFSPLYMGVTISKSYSCFGSYARLYIRLNHDKLSLFDHFIKHIAWYITDPQPILLLYSPMVILNIWILDKP